MTQVRREFDPFANATTFPNRLFKLLGVASPAAFAVAVALERFAYGKKRTCRPSVKTIASLVSSCERTVQRRLRELERVGYLSRQLGVGNRATVYTLAGDKFGNGDALEGRATQEVTSKAECAGKNVGDRRHECRTEVTQVSPQESNEELKEETNQPSQESRMDGSFIKPNTESADTGLRRLFERVKGHYPPAKIGCAKMQEMAWAEFKKIAPSEKDVEKWIKAINHQKTTQKWNDNNGQFIPMLKNWIAKKYFNDRAGLPDVDAVLERAMKAQAEIREREGWTPYSKAGRLEVP